MLNVTSNWVILKYFGYVLFVLSAYQSWQVYDAANKKIATQVVINKNVSQVKQTWAALQPSIAKWDKTYLHNNTVKDLVSLNENLNILQTGLKPKEDILVEGSAEAVVFEGVDIGLAERCIKNSAGGYALSASSVNAFLNGMEMIDQRADLTWKKVIIKADKGSFIIRYSQLCSRYRIGE